MTKSAPPNALAQRVTERLTVLNISQAQASRRMQEWAVDHHKRPVAIEFVRDVCNGKKTSIRGANVEALAFALDVSTDWVLGLPDKADLPGTTQNAQDRVLTTQVPIVGRTHANRWVDRAREPLGADAPASGSAAVAAIPGYDMSKVYMLEVADNQADLEYPQGSLVILEPVSKGDVAEGDHVLVEQERAGLVERTIRVVERDGKGWRLFAPSSDPALRADTWKYDPKSDTGPQIVAVVAGQQRWRPRRNRIT